MKESKTKQTLSVYLKHVRNYPKYAIGILIGVPTTVLVYQFLPPIILANVLNRLSKHAYIQNQVWTSFGGDLILYTILMLFGGVVMWRIVDAFVWRLEASVERDMGRQVYQHLISQSANFHANSFQLRHFGGASARAGLPE